MRRKKGHLVDGGVHPVGVRGRGKARGGGRGRGIGGVGAPG